ncbi:MAG: glycosyltransferase family 4 protein, partial [bacterium]
MKRKPKIAVIGAKGFPALGGAARANEAIFTRLKDKYDVTVYAISSHASVPDYHGIKQIIFNAYKNKKITVFLYYIRSLLHALFNGNYDLVHVNHASAGFIVPFLKLRFKTVLNVRGGIKHDYDNKWKWREKQLFYLFHWMGFRFASKVVTVQKGSVPMLEPYSSGNIIFIPNGVDHNIEILPNNLTLKYDITFSAARIIYLKGLHLLFEALNDIKFNGKVQIVGDIDQVSEYKNYILNLAENLDCEFTGLVQSKLELFKRIGQSRLFVFPSYSEGMSNMLLEAASLRVPIIASDIEQNKDVFNDEEMLFFERGRSKDLAEKIRYAIDNQGVMTDKA